ncbi:MAG: endonuclease/exonuclease/phosphatase family protein [Neomegalonema sp.]|nr:endonuclease/exonuclease/phosphatase family protein [Neomegalonema sp.]
MSAGAPLPTLRLDQAQRIGTLNLYHWATPDIGWYGPDSRHTPEGWAAKVAWLGDTLSAMDAAVVGFQEVVSIEALRDVAAAAGYPYLETVAEPHFSAENEKVYNRPVQAVAAKYPIRASRAKPPEGVAGALGLSHDRDFRRAPVEAHIELPAFGDVVVFCAHLKSPGVGVGDALIAGRSSPPDAPEAAARWTLEALSRAHAAASIQRVFEASALFHLAAERMAEAPERPVLIMGDLNDEPDSPALSALTAYRPFERDGGADDPEESGAEVDYAAQFRMIDAQRLAPRSLWSDERRPTHRAGARGNAIDFILVSPALHPWVAAKAGVVADFAVLDRWFRRADPAAASDHAGLLATIAPIN